VWMIISFPKMEFFHYWHAYTMEYIYFPWEGDLQTTSDNVSL
jgi:hypothetical protein